MNAAVTAASGVSHISACVPQAHQMLEKWKPTSMSEEIGELTPHDANVAVSAQVAITSSRVGFCTRFKVTCPTVIQSWSNVAC